MKSWLEQKPIYIMKMNGPKKEIKNQSKKEIKNIYNLTQFTIGT